MQAYRRGESYEVDFTEEIDRGVTLLDRHDPRWFDMINLDELQLDLPRMCVLGQLAMGVFREKIQELTHDPDDDAEYNFYHVADYLFETGQTGGEYDEEYGFTIDLPELHKLLAAAGIPSLDPHVDPFDRVNVAYKRVWEMLTLQWVSRIEKCRADAGTLGGATL